MVVSCPALTRQELDTSGSLFFQSGWIWWIQTKGTAFASAVIEMADFTDGFERW